MFNTGKNINQRKEKMPLPKPCKRCSKKYQPNTKFSKLCDDCIIKSNKKRKDENKTRI